MGTNRVRMLSMVVAACVLLSFCGDRVFATERGGLKASGEIVEAWRVEGANRCVSRLSGGMLLLVGRWTRLVLCSLLGFVGSRRRRFR